MPNKLRDGRLVLRIAIWGPEGAGKHTLLSWIGQDARASRSGLRSSETDPVLEEAGGFRRYPVPSAPLTCWEFQVAGPNHPASFNEQVLRHADGVIFVISSEDSAWESGLTCLHALFQIAGDKLVAQKKQGNLPAIPLATCANKWDLHGTVTGIFMRDVLDDLGLQSSPIFETVATTGTNVNLALVHICRECFLHNHGQVESNRETTFKKPIALPAFKFWFSRLASTTFKIRLQIFAWPRISLVPLVRCLKEWKKGMALTLERGREKLVRAYKSRGQANIRADADLRFKRRQLQLIERYMLEGEIEQFFARVKDGGKAALGWLVRRQSVQDL